MSSPTIVTPNTGLEASSEDGDWDLVIRPHSGWFDLRLAEVWAYRDLLWMFVKRDFVAVYKQTILGPLWFFIQPLLTTLVFTIVFSGIAGISTDGHPPVLFYLAGTIPWNYFAACLNKTSTTFTSNAHIFGKVYFPRLIVPLSVVVSNLIQFGIQLLLFMTMFAWYAISGTTVQPNWIVAIVLTPVLLLMMAALGLGSGIIVSALTTKYRDLTFLLAFGVQLGMYATPIIFPLSKVPERWNWLVSVNPMTGPVEAFRASLLGGEIPWGLLVMNGLTIAALLAVGVVLFTRVERSFIDTV